MSQFYINSVKKRMKWQKLDLDNLQEEQISSSGGGTTSPEEEILYEESAEREDAISELRKRLHDDFSHILDDNIDVSLNLNSNKQDNISNQESKESNFNSSELNEAVAVLSNIEDKVSLDNEEEQKSNNFDMKEQSPKILLGLISELRVLSERRTRVKSKLSEVDSDLVKLQEKIIIHKKQHEKQIQHLQSINQIYSQSVSLVSKIVSEETDYEKL